MIKRMAHIILCLLATCNLAGAQTGLVSRPMTMEEVISVARTQSVPAVAAKSSFISKYWAFRSYKASRLPSLNLYGRLANFDRSLKLLQNYNTGEIAYTGNYNMQNSIGLAIKQNIALTGGTLSVYSDLTRLDQFGQNYYKLWYAQPLSLSYTQPLFAYNSLKWESRIAPKEYEKARQEYIEAMESITMEAVSRYYSLMTAKHNHNNASVNYENTKTMHHIAAERMKLGSVTRDEYLQIELRMLNDSISINDSYIRLREAQMALNSLLGYDERQEIEPVQNNEIPNIQLNYEQVLEKSLTNSSFWADNKIKELTVESELEKAKASRGISVSINANLGLSNSATDLPATYRNLLNQEVVGITFSLPVFDWGVGEGRVKKAQARTEAVKAEVEQAENDYRRNIFTLVGLFNNQKRQCDVSRKAAAIAEERYSLMMEKFRKGNASVMELNTSREEYDDARKRQISDLCDFWKYFYSIRKMTLYDFIADVDIQENFDELTR